MNFELSRPLVFFDLETTGLNPSNDRIIEYCFIKVFPNKERREIIQRINPQMPLSKDAQKITGISLQDLKDEPLFGDKAREVYEFLQGCDIAGYNILRFDVLVLKEEFKRCDISWDLSQHHFLDMQRIFHQKEKRDLAAALKFYCQEEIENAHCAVADVLATIKVFEGQIARYDDLGTNAKEIALFCKDPKWVDSTGRIHWINQEASLAFSKKKGKSLRQLAQSDKGMLKWILNNNFPQDVKDIVQDALEGKFPKKDNDE